MSEREKVMETVKIAEKAMLFEKIREAVDKLIALDPKLRSEERKAFVAVHKKLIGDKKTSWRALNSLRKSEKDEERKKVIVAMQKELEPEIEKMCLAVILTIEKQLVPVAKDDQEALAFYHKSSGDFSRYVAEINDDEKAKRFKENTKKSYESAEKCYELATQTEEFGKKSDKSQKEYVANRQALLLNQAIFHYELLDDPGNACIIAERALKLGDESETVLLLEKNL